MKDAITASANSIRILQFTDTHLFADSDKRLLGVDTAASFSEVYQLAKATCGIPDLYIFTGDLSQDETEESYRRLSELVGDAGAPCYFLPGNHDRRQELFRGLVSRSCSFKESRHVLIGGWQIILLDTLVEDKVWGSLAPDQLAFLEDALAKNPERHSLICLHHHPVSVGAAWIDNIGLQNSSEFLALVDRFPNVRCVLWGHIHQEFQVMRGDVPYIATPSTCVQFKPRSDTFAVDLQAPGFRYLELEEFGRIKTKVLRIADLAPGLEISSSGY